MQQVRHLYGYLSGSQVRCSYPTTHVTIARFKKIYDTHTIIITVKINKQY